MFNPTLTGLLSSQVFSGNHSLPNIKTIKIFPILSKDSTFHKLKLISEILWCSSRPLTQIWRWSLVTSILSLTCLTCRVEGMLQHYWGVDVTTYVIRISFFLKTRHYCLQGWWEQCWNQLGTSHLILHFSPHAALTFTTRSSDSDTNVLSMKCSSHTENLYAKY